MRQKRFCGDFIWGSTSDQPKRHFISWETICIPKGDGDLDFCTLRAFKQVFFF